MVGRHKGKELVRRCVLALPLFLPVHSAHAEDYPYSGLFWAEWQDEVTANLDLYCALSFFEQKKEGDWVAYHVDLAGFRQTGEVKYLQVATGHCTYDPDSKVEACVTLTDKSYPEGEGSTVYDVIGQIDDGKIQTVVYEDRAALTAALASADGLASGIPQNFLRCPFPEDRMRALTVPEFTYLSPDAVNALRSPSAALLTDPDVRSIAAKLTED